MGNDKESKEKETLDELTGLADSTRRPPLGADFYFDHLKKDYDLLKLIGAKAITHGDLKFIARVQSELDKYSYAANIDMLSQEALLGASAVIGAEERVLGLYIRRKYKDLMSIIHMFKRSKQ